MADKFHGGIIAGATEVSLTVSPVLLATGQPPTGILAASVTASYYRQGAAAPVAVAVTDLAALDSDHAAGGWHEIGTTARYRLDFPDAAFADGAEKVLVMVEVTGCAPMDAEFPLTLHVGDAVRTRDSELSIAAIGGEAELPEFCAIRAEREALCDVEVDADAGQVVVSTEAGGESHRLDVVVDAAAAPVVSRARA